MKKHQELFIGFSFMVESFFSLRTLKSRFVRSKDIFLAHISGKLGADCVAKYIKLIREVCSDARIDSEHRILIVQQSIYET